MHQKRAFPFSYPLVPFNKRQKQDMTRKQVWANQARSSFAMSPLSRVNNQATPMSEIIALNNAGKIPPWFSEPYHAKFYETDNVVVGCGYVQSGEVTGFHSHSHKAVALFLGSVANFKTEIAPATYSKASSCWFRTGVLRGGDCFIQRVHGPNQPLIHRGISVSEPYGFLLIECPDPSIPSLSQAPLITCINPLQAKFEHKLNSEFCSTVSLTIDPDKDVTLHIEEYAQYIPFCRIICGAKDLNHIQTQVGNGMSCHKITKEVNGINVEFFIIDNIQCFDDTMLAIKNAGDSTWTGYVVDLYGSSSAKRVR